MRTPNRMHALLVPQRVDNADAVGSRTIQCRVPNRPSAGMGKLVEIVQIVRATVNPISCIGL